MIRECESLNFILVWNSVCVFQKPPFIDRAIDVVSGTNSKYFISQSHCIASGDCTGKLDVLFFLIDGHWIQH